MASIPKTNRVPGTPGYSPIIRLASVADIDALPEPAAGSNLISADITFKPSKGWATIECTPDTVGCPLNWPGEEDSQSMEGNLSFRVPNTDYQVIALADALKGAYLVALLQDADGNYKVIGSAANPGTFMNAEGGNGTKNTDSTGLVYSIKFRRAKMRQYTGEIFDLA